MEKKTAVTYLFIFILLYICAFLYGMQRLYGFMIYPDEFGYWASAARLSGYDWSGITSLGSYYSFGYSILLFPVFHILENPVSAYRMAAGINMLMLCLGICIVYRILRKIFSNHSEPVLALISGMTLFYPAWIFYMQVTLTEVTLMFLHIIICYLFICFLENPRVCTVCALAVSIGYIYIVHMRTVGMVIACAVTLLIWAAGNRRNRRKALTAGIILGILVMAGLYIKQVITGQLYMMASTEMLAVNDYSGQWSKITAIFSSLGLKRLMISCVGKLFYLGMATFGTFYWGMAYLIIKVKEMGKVFREKEKCGAVHFFCLFLLLTVVGQFLISAVYMMDSERIDTLVYGRYNEYILPVVMAAGILQMLKTRHLIKTTIIMIALQALAVLLINYAVNAFALSDIRGYFTVGISYMLQEDGFCSNTFFWRAYALGALLSMGVMGMVWLIRRNIRMSWLFGIIVVVQIILGLQASRHYTYQYNDVNYSDLTLIKTIKEKNENQEKGVSDLIYIYEGGLPFIGLLQFQIPDYQIQVFTEHQTEDDSFSESDMVIVGVESKYRDELSEQFDTFKKSSRFYLYYNSKDS